MSTDFKSTGISDNGNEYQL